LANPTAVSKNQFLSNLWSNRAKRHPSRQSQKQFRATDASAVAAEAGAAGTKALALALLQLVRRIP
jgi:hypothetical protein